jgi:hypothetical protein
LRFGSDRARFLEQQMLPRREHRDRMLGMVDRARADKHRLDIFHLQQVVDRRKPHPRIETGEAAGPGAPAHPRDGDEIHVPAASRT